LNGERLKPEFLGARSKRCEVRVALEEGWNCFCGHVEFLTQAEFYDGVFGWPREAGLVLAAGPEGGEVGRFRLSPLVKPEEVGMWLDQGRPVEREGWVRCMGNPDRLTPARVMAWRRLKGTVLRDRIYGPGVDGEAAAGGHLWVFDFSEEFVGHVALDVEGPAGMVVDLAYDEWLRPDGLVDLYRTNPFVNTAERFILRGGRQTVRTLNVRGGRFLQVAVTPPDGAARMEGRARLHGVWVDEVRSLSRGEATFGCGDEELERIWEASVQTVVASAEDGYSDSPWRERGTYVGDFGVNQAIHQLFCADFSVPRRGLRVFAQAQLENGQIPAVAPAHHRKPHEDFTLIWILALHDHWSLTGDVGVVEELWPAVERVWGSKAWVTGPEGLWSSETHNLFVDWGIELAERGGWANAVINAFRVAALDRSAELAAVTGRERRAGELRMEAELVRRAFSRVLWREDERRFAAFVNEQGQRAESTAIHGNALAWAFGIGSAAQREQVQQYVLARLERNFDLGLERGLFGGHLELYFWSYVLPVLAEQGFHQAAVRWIRQHWGYATEDGFGTLPECFCRKNSGEGSKCHSWSGFPAVFLTRYLLGLRQARRGDPNEWVLDPLPVEGLDWAEGCQPHADGMIRVAWERTLDGRIEARVEAPESVRVRVLAGRARVPTVASV
ncbi:MAG: family 78 glycoside hydrolase catalytic domain, partial [Verrucomicrobiia bacterium]